MGRILSGGANSSSAGGGTSQNLSTVVVTGEPVVQGQLACVGTDGLAYYALDPAAPGGALRPVSGAAAPGLPFAAGPAQALPGATGIFSAGCALANGNAVLVGTAGNSLQFGIYNPLGVLQGGMVTLTHVSPSINLYAVALTGGGFALAYQDQGTLAATVAVFSNTGAQILAPWIVEAGVGTTSLAIAALSGGGFAVAYCNSGGAVRYAVFSASGAVVQAPAATGLTSIVTTSPCAISVGALQAGGFVVAGLSSGNASAYFSRFNATGVVQQSAIAAYTGGAATVTYGTVSAVGLATGGFVIVQYSNGVSSTIVTTLSASGVAVGLTYGIGNTSSSFVPAFTVVARADGTALVNTQGYLFIANSNGSIGAQASIVNGFGNAVVQADGGLIVAFAGPGSIDIRDVNLSLIGTLQSSALGIGNAIVNTTPACLLSVGRSPVRPAVPLLLMMTPGAGPRYVTLALNGAAVQKTTTIGVFGASAAAGSSVPVQYQGVATLASGFLQPFSSDANSAFPPGQRMAIVGNQAILSGLQPPQNRRQIN
ncbi:hypothetical protein Jab_1c24990 [Janthinobacterium sp. HH01]|uniref:hypothetical protein n=1 Tax=Janthinobacterium sp. HH01 TaxID=1198452 RepID=UPI0002AEA850|nr:hypothetical protein [Janthinobacterium sp. HH01]ELX13859.1 hypothetical protein Jab_1c24990 [Janthinobacterium sp. HH01]